MPKALFLHGGPGFTSEAERRQLAEPLRCAGFDFHFWNEPSRNRPDGFAFTPEKAWTGWLESIDESIRRSGPFDLLVGSSFGALASLHVIARNPGVFQGLVMVSPTLDMLATLHRMMDIAAKDFMVDDPVKAERIQTLKSKSGSIADESTREAMELVYQDPRLVAHYWVSDEKLRQWAGVFSDPCFGMDAESQRAVQAEFSQSAPLPLVEKFGCLPIAVLLGDRDPVRDESQTQDICRPYASNYEIHRFCSSAHFPHLEEPEKFIQVLKASFATGA